MLRRLVQLVSPRNCRKTTMITPVTPQTSRRTRHHSSGDFRMRVCSTPTGAQDLASDSNSLRTHPTDCTWYTIPLYNYHPEQTFPVFRTCEIVICQVSFFSAEVFWAALRQGNCTTLYSALEDPAVLNRALRCPLAAPRPLKYRIIHIGIPRARGRTANRGDPRGLSRESRARPTPRAVPRSVRMLVRPTRTAFARADADGEQAATKKAKTETSLVLQVEFNYLYRAYEGIYVSYEEPRRARSRS